MEERTPSGAVRQWLSATPYLLPWLPVAAFATFIKLQMLVDLGYMLVLRGLGREEYTEGLTTVEHASLFAEDILLGFLVAPALLILVCRYLPGRWRAPFTAVVSMAAMLFLFANLLSYANIGRFLTWRLASDAVQWVSQNPVYIGAYLSLSAAVKIGGLLVVIAVLATTARYLDRWLARRVRPGAALAAIALPAMLVLPTTWLADIPHTAYHDSVLRSVVDSLLVQPVTLASSTTEPDELIGEFRRLSATPPYQRDDDLFGVTRGHNLLYFVLETAPTRVLDPTGPLEGMPHLHRLRERALVATRHHTTYPYTSDALFSIFSGWYPIDELRYLLLRRNDLSLPGPIAALTEQGYATAVYSPLNSRFSADDEMFDALGFGKFTLSHAGLERDFDGHWDHTIQMDQEVFDQLMTNMKEWLESDQPFAAAFLPQAGHGPWPDIAGNGDDWPARGRAIVAWQDRWLGEIVALLEEYGELENTVIVVTSDHGVRTRQEDPAFAGGRLDAYSYEVPLVIHAPAAFGQTRWVEPLTSHVDLAPTLLDLFGLPGARERLHGLPLWDERIAERRTFFFGRGYLGADGFHQAGRFFMHNHLFGADYANSTLAFDEGHLLRAEQSDVAERELLAGMAGLREVWIERFGSTADAIHRIQQGAGADTGSRPPQPSPAKQ